MEAYRHRLRTNIRELVEETDSEWGQFILNNIVNFMGKFWMISLKAASLDALMTSIESRPE